MQLRRLGRSGLAISPLSIGAMRFPRDEDAAIALIRRAIDLGCNYIDTSLGYGNEKPDGYLDSELRLAKALKDGYRERVYLSTKCSPWILQEEGYTASAADARRKIDLQMKRLEVDYLDFYQVWNITDADTFKLATRPDGMVTAIHQAMKAGLVRHIAVTTHAPLPVMHEIIDCGIFEAVTVSYHLLYRELEEVMAHAQRADMGVIVMNPMGGGTLGADSAVIRGFLPEFAGDSRTLALKFVLDNPDVTTAICGFERISDIEQNIAAAGLPPLTAEQRGRLAAGVAALEPERKRFCTQCGYCMPCPEGVLIKNIFSHAANARLFGLLESAQMRYRNWKPEWKADRCTKCGVCEEKCTNKLSIRDELQSAHELLK
jgi:uncharacterized protein